MGEKNYHALDEPCAWPFHDNLIVFKFFHAINHQHLTGVTAYALCCSHIR